MIVKWGCSFEKLSDDWMLHFMSCSGMLQLGDDNPPHWLLSFSVAGCEDSIWCGREPLSYLYWKLNILHGLMEIGLWFVWLHDDVCLRLDLWWLHFTSYFSFRSEGTLLLFSRGWNCWLLHLQSGPWDRDPNRDKNPGTFPKKLAKCSKMFLKNWSNSLFQVKSHIFTVSSHSVVLWQLSDALKTED